MYSFGRAIILLILVNPVIGTYFWKKMDRTDNKNQLQFLNDRAMEANAESEVLYGVGMQMNDTKTKKRKSPAGISTNDLVFSAHVGRNEDLFVELLTLYVPEGSTV